MRSSGCTVQQALTSEAAAVVKQAVSLARRRGHAQVTPLHVANAMLSSSSSAGLLRQACLQSHTHPLQCRALELCFNVALNRLPASTSVSPLLPGPHHPHPSVSNALVAAFKRAQAHQRRGSIENHQHQQQYQQQQAILAVKVEVEQLIISILDDPSVSRVMREAGFSSILVKAKVEQAISTEIMSPNNTKDNHSKNPNDDDDHGDHHHHGDIKESGTTKDWSGHVNSEDVSSVIEGLLMCGKKKKCCVVVGECLATLEGAIKGTMDRIERRDSVVDALRDVRFESLSFDSSLSLSRDEVDQKIAQVTRLVKCYSSKGLVLYLGDLRWAIELQKGGGGDVERRRSGYYCPIEHIITKLKHLVLECNDETMRLWLIGVATFNTYTRFGSGSPSLEAIWGFHAITIPAGSLGLSLIPESDALESKKTNVTPSWLPIKDGSQEDRFDKNTCNSESTTPSLPSWLQKYKDENKELRNNTKQDSIPVKDLCKSWSFSERTLSFSPVSPPMASEFSYDRQQYFNPQQTLYNGFEVEPKYFWISTDNPTSNGAIQTTLSMYAPSSILKSNSMPISTSSSDGMEMECTKRSFKDFNAWSIENLCNALEKEVPWKKDIIRDIASTIFDCRSRKGRRKEDDDQKRNDCSKEATWLFFLGDDIDGKEKISRELARLIFGSKNKYISIGLSSFSSTEDSGNKRLRDEQSFTFADRLIEAILVDPHRVFFVEDIEQVDYVSQVGIKRAIERGKMRSALNGEEVSLGDAIIILSCERFSSRSRPCSPSTKQIVQQHYHQGGPTREEGKIGCCSDESNGSSTSPGSLSLDLNISISDDCAFHDQDFKEQSCIDELGLLASVDKCVLFKL